MGMPTQDQTPAADAEAPATKNYKIVNGYLSRIEGRGRKTYKTGSVVTMTEAQMKTYGKGNLQEIKAPAPKDDDDKKTAPKK